MYKTQSQHVPGEVDGDVRRQAKTFIRSARFASLACLAAADGSPLISQVNVATDLDGSPGFLISSLSQHYNALGADPRCALLFGVPGKGDPAAHPRVSITGDARRLEHPADIERMRRRFLARHPKSALYVDFADFAFWRMYPKRAYFNGGFGKAYEMAAGDILTDPQICADLEHVEAAVVADINHHHADTVALCAIRLLNRQPGDWQVASLDNEGADLKLGDMMARLWFDEPLSIADDLRPHLMQLMLSEGLKD